MKSIFTILFIIAAIVGGIYWWQSDADIPESSVILVQPTNPKQQLSSQSVAKDTAEQQQALAQQAEQALVSQKEVLTNTEQELQVLMQEYNTLLNSPDERAKVKKKLDALLAQYNEQVLPVALDAMAQGNDS